jgi:hypothetical protein
MAAQVAPATAVVMMAAIQRIMSILTLPSPSSRKIEMKFRLGLRFG